MAVKFFRLRINGTDETVLNNIKSWWETQIEQSDLHEQIGDGNVFVITKLEGGFLLICDMYLLPTVDSLKYRNILGGYWSSLDKSTITDVQVIQYDECSHDSSNPQPCIPIVMFEWVN